MTGFKSVSVRVCEIEGEREDRGERGERRNKERGERVCVCTCVRVC